MNISVQKMLNKIEEQLKEAKSTQKESILRERVHAIKLLCELVLEDNSEQQGYGKNNWAVSSFEPVSVPSIETISLQSKRLEEEEANGDSLLDF